MARLAFRDDDNGLCTEVVHWDPQVKTPHQRLGVVLLYGGLDQSLREVAGTVT
jgi:hypothetical protein